MFLDVKEFIEKSKIEWSKHPFSFLGSTASILGLLNLAISVPTLISVNVELSFPALVGVNLILRICIFILLEGVLASFFGLIFVVLRMMGPGYSMVLLIINSLRETEKNICPVVQDALQVSISKLQRYEH